MATKARKSDQAQARVEFRMPADLKQEVDDAAARVGSTFTAFATQLLIEHARRIQKQHTTSVLNREAQIEFAEMILNPPAPSEALRKTVNTRKVTL